MVDCDPGSDIKVQIKVNLILKKDGKHIINEQLSRILVVSIWQNATILG